MADEPEGLSDFHKKVLDIEGRNIIYPGDKDRIVKDQLGISLTRYYQHVNALRSNPDAWTYAGPALARANRRLSQEKRSNGHNYESLPLPPTQG